MKYCPNCGKGAKDSDIICERCGYWLKRKNKNYSDNNDGPSFAMAFLGFISLILGVILFLACKSSTPQKADSAIRGALVGFCIKLVVPFLLLVFYFL